MNRSHSNASRTPTAITESQSKTPSKSLYATHFISTWNARGFEFGSVLFLASIYPNTLRPLSIYALVRATAAIALSYRVGYFIDTKNRLTAIRISILGQRIAVVFSCLGFLLLLQVGSLSGLAGATVFAFLTLLACVEKLCSTMNTVAVERDWVVVIAGQDADVLQDMNSQMRRIDLFCKLVSPLVIALLDGISTTMAVGVTLFINAVLVGAEYYLAAWVYYQTPSLATCRDSRADGDDELAMTESHVETQPDLIETPTKSRNDKLFGPLMAYVQSHAFLPSLSLSLLYLTVLSFSGQMVTYLLSLSSPRLTSTHVGVLRAVSTMIEMSATFAAPALVDHLGAVRAGIWCLSWQLICLMPGVGSLWILTEANATVATAVFITSVVLSRIGLWSFDLTAQLLIQNSVDARQRGSFSSTEASLQNFFEMCTFVTTIVWAKPQDFKWPAAVSMGAVYIAAGCYAHFVRRRRGHLLHLPKCWKLPNDYDPVPALEDFDQIGHEYFTTTPIELPEMADQRD